MSRSGLSGRNTPADQPLLSIVVPAYNEEATLSEIVARLLAVPEAGEIVTTRITPGLTASLQVRPYSQIK